MTTLNLLYEYPKEVIYQFYENVWHLNVFHRVFHSKQISFVWDALSLVIFKVEHNGFPHGVFLIEILTILLLED